MGEIGNRYRYVKPLGKGGMGVVCQVWDKRLNKMWAMKAVAIRSNKLEEASCQQILSEIKLLKQLNHPLLPQIVDMIQTENYIGMIMEYIEGITLEEYLDKKKTITQEETVHMGIELAGVLAYLHRQRPPVIYGDLKPSNIMIRTDGSLKLIDFGTAMESSMGEKGRGKVYGTYGYAAPEQLKGGSRDRDTRSDIYGLGTTLYHMVTGQNPSKPPFTIQPIRNTNQTLSEGLEQIICRCTRNKRQERYQSAEACIADLQRYQALTKRKVRGRKTCIGVYYLLLLSAVVAIFGPIPDIALPLLLFALTNRMILFATGRKEQFILWQEENILLSEKKNIGLPIS